MSDRKHPASIDVAGTPYLRDAKGALVPLAVVKTVDLLMDEAVRETLVEARELSRAIATFKAKAFERVGGLQALLAQEYGATIGGKKGNIQLLTYDGCQRVQVAVADMLEFGPELQAAKAIIDECLIEWASGGDANLQAIVSRAFSVDKQGQINRTELFMLLRVGITDPRWLKAMEAIRDSIRVVGSRTYMRIYDRPAPDAAWRAIGLDMAAV